MINKSLTHNFRGFFTVISLSAIFAVVCPGCGNYSPEDPETIPRRPEIYPDYTGIVIPPNIAPLNFTILEKGNSFHVRIKAVNGYEIVLKSDTPSIMIPADEWKTMLKTNSPGSFSVTVSCLEDSVWKKYEPFRDTIAGSSIDQFLAYRKIDRCVKWVNMGYYQRDVTTFREKRILHNRTINKGCMNCHSFRNNNPEEMILQIRAKGFGTPMLLKNRSRGFKAVSTKTAHSHGKAGFTSWHPDKELIAFSLNSFKMLFVKSGPESREVFDKAADIAVYNIETKEVTTHPALSDSGFIETWPEWSRDGKYLYFSRSPQKSYSEYDKIKCSLMRLEYDKKTEKWGKLDTVLSADSVNGSINQPRFSPDGRYLLFNVADHGDFPIDKPSSDLYIFDTREKEFKKLSICSPWSESWHCWSKNGRWITYTSKRGNGKFARIYFSYFDKKGRFHKPFILPQKDSEFYHKLIQVYNVPELLIKPLDITEKKSRKALEVFLEKEKVQVDEATGASPEYDQFKGGH